MPRKPKVAAPVWPSAAIQVAYQRDLRLQIIKPMAADLLHVLEAAWRDDIGVVGDARPEQPRDAHGRWTHTAEVDIHVAELGPDDPAEQFTETSHHESEANAMAHVEKVRARIARRVDNGRHTIRATRIKPYAADVAADARPNPNKLRTVMERWGKKWTARLETLAEKMAREFATANRTYTDNAMRKVFREAGLTITFRPSKRMLEGFAAVVYENVQLIKSIPQKFLLDVQSDVWLSATKGADRAALTEKIKESYGVSWRRAAFISRDQTAKAKAVFEASRRAELGIKRAVWMHSHAGREPRPTHVAMNNKTYDVVKGMYDKDEGEWVHPGELINCRCSSGSIIPGFD